MLIEEGMGVKERRIVFKVAALKNWVGVGVCLRDRIAGASYAFKCRWGLTQMSRWATAAT